MNNDTDIKSALVILAVLLLVFIGPLAFWGFGGFGLIFPEIDYSSGYRDGHLQKISEKGVLAKVWYGEVAMPGWKIGGESVWTFACVDEDVRKQLQALNAHQFARFHYKEVLNGSPWTGQAYRVVRVELLGKEAAP